MDVPGYIHHITIPSHTLKEEDFTDGIWKAGRLLSATVDAGKAVIVVCAVTRKWFIYD